MRRLALLALALGLAGCAHTFAPRQVCLPMKTMTAADRAALDAAMDAVSDGTPIAEAIEDYTAMRRANRIACRKAGA